MFQFTRILLRLNICNNHFPIFELTPKKCCLFLHHHPSPISTAINFFSTTSASDPHRSFTISYLTNNCGFSQEAALKAYKKRVRFGNPQNPDSVLAFFRTYGFSHTQIHSIIGRAPELLKCNPSTRILPKFEFLASKGFSHSNILLMVTRNPNLLCRSLKNHMIPFFELVTRFFPSGEMKAIACLIACPFAIVESVVAKNVKMLLHQGLTHSCIHRLLTTRASILSSTDLSETVKELKQLGFDPSLVSFSEALLAKRAVTKSGWDAKVEALKTWGWSDQEISDAFRRQPHLMLHSKDKLNAVMNFWIGQLGWDPLVLCMRPNLFGYSLEKRLIPRASVIRYLLSKGFMKKNVSLATPFELTEKSFLQKFVTCFEENETTQLLKLYHGEC